MESQFLDGSSSACFHRAVCPGWQGARIELAEVRRPQEERNLLGGDAEGHLAGRRFVGADRRGNILLLPSDDGSTVVINPMLARRLHYGVPLRRDRVRDAPLLQPAGGPELRQHDAKDMGKICATRDLDLLPGYEGLGPHAPDPEPSVEVFRERLRPCRGETEGILSDQSFVAGMGNAYANEVCWRAELYPFRRRPSLSDEGVGRLYEAMRDVLVEAIETLEARAGDEMRWRRAISWRCTARRARPAAGAGALSAR